MNIIVNGQERELDAALSVLAFLATIGFDGRFVAVARNGEVLERDTFGQVMLADGDRLEVVRPVGGG